MPVIPLALLVLTAAAPAAPLSPEAWVDRQCKEFGAAPGEPWAIAHAVGAYGKGFKTRDGKPAIDAMITDFLQQNPLDTGRKWSLPEFEDTLSGKIPVEPHRDHQLMTTVRAGVPLTHAFASKAGKVTVAELLDDAQQHLPASPSDGFYRDGPWTLDALASTKTEAAAAKSAPNLVSAMDGFATWVDGQQRFLDEARKAGAQVQKRKQDIWSLPCGGFHHIQAAFGPWAREKGFRERHAAEYARLVDVLVYRLDTESAIYDDALARAPEYRLQLLVQKLKFYGHWMETVGRLQSVGAWPAKGPAKDAIGRARTQLEGTIRALDGDGVYAKMAELKTTKTQLYLDLVGDSCHAVNGLKVR